MVLARHVDLLHPQGKWWLVLDAKGRRAAAQPMYGFADARIAIDHASQLMRRHFSRAGKARHAPRWERFSVDGLGPCAELLIPGVRNLLLHLRTNVCSTEDGRRVIFLDEVQSDWHASLAMHRDANTDDPHRTDPTLPFSLEWPLLALKFALWWAGQNSLDGIAWSTPALHLDRWNGHNPPTEVYRRGLPDAARRLARVLTLDLALTGLLRLTSQSGRAAGPGLASGRRGWQACVPRVSVARAGRAFR